MSKRCRSRLRSRPGCDRVPVVCEKNPFGLDEYDNINLLLFSCHFCIPNRKADYNRSYSCAQKRLTISSILGLGIYLIGFKKVLITEIHGFVVGHLS